MADSAPHDTEHDDLSAASRPDALYQETFFTGRQTALILGGMGFSFLVLLVILFIVA